MNSITFSLSLPPPLLATWYRHGLVASWLTSCIFWLCFGHPRQRWGCPGGDYCFTAPGHHISPAPYHTIFPYHTIPYHTLLLHIIPYCHIIPYHIIPYCSISYHIAISYHTISYSIAPYHIMHRKSKSTNQRQHFYYHNENGPLEILLILCQLEVQ